MKILVSGAGIAGPAFAFWMARSGHDVTIIESAPELRRGGYIVDFWGIGYDIAEKMGLIAEIRARGYQVEEVRYVGSDGRRVGGFAVDSLIKVTNGRFTSVRRSDISSIMFDAVRPEMNAIFGDTITSISDDGTKVNVTFRNGPDDSFDLVVGADGLHSAVRSLAFGTEEKFENFLGYYVAAAEFKGYPHRDELVYMMRSVPGRQLSRFSMRDDSTMVLFVFREEYMNGAGVPPDTQGKKQMLNDIFGDTGWEARDILDALSDVPEIYFDKVSQIKMPTWHKGNVGLIGDAGACVSLLAGEGTGLALAEAYFLAGEISRSEGDLEKAFTAYENRLRELVASKQRSAESFASFFAPKTSIGLKFRDWLTAAFKIPFLSDLLWKWAFRDDIEVPDYKFSRKA